jgi:transposase InsO family protein
MPFQERTMLEQKREFVHLATQATMPFATLCARFGISRPTGYKWVHRYAVAGDAGLQEQSRRPRTSPARTAESIEAAVVDLRQAHPQWGGEKLRARLLATGLEGVPSGRTCTAILQRHGLLDVVPPVPQAWHRFEAEAPNDLWQLDFKGPLPQRQGRLHALSVLDDHSRYLVGLTGCADQTDATIRAAMTVLFARYGLPWRILTDNGPPWGNPNPAQPLTRFSIWLIRLGIAVSHGRPFHPQTQGKVERFHRTLQSELLAGRPLPDPPTAQAAFDAWRLVYNTERPHRALGLTTPVSHYTGSPRSFPDPLPPIVYGADDEVRTVYGGGQIRYRGHEIFLSQALKRQPVALRPTPRDGVVLVVYCHQPLGLLDLHPATGPVFHMHTLDPEAL